MANKIKLTIQVDDDGSLAIVGKKAKEAAGATDKLDKSTKQLGKSNSATYRTMQGAAHTSSNLTKNFAKQSQGISGVLVPAYAALAANIFAVTALFGALSRAAQVEQLTAGLGALGAQSGIAMNTLARGLQNATGNAISLEEAMRSTALTMSAGFGADTLDRLGEVAKNASIALGRDTADAMGRLTRGATKLEPELLDELGIMVRLDEAAQDFARANNKLASELTLAEKRQAFMNAVLEEGERKFAAIGKAVDTNPYDRLAASFNDLSKTILTGINTVLVPAVDLLTSSTIALVGALTVFGSTVLRSMAPSITDIGERYSDLAIAQENTSKATLGFVSNLDEVPAGFRRLAAGLEDSTDQMGDLEKMVKSSQKSIDSFADKQEKATAGTAKGDAQIQRSIKGIKNSTTARNAATAALIAQRNSQILLQEAELAGLVSSGRLRDALDGLPGLFEKIDDNYKKGAIGGSVFAKVNATLSASFAKLAVRVRLLGLAFVQALPMIGLVVAAVGALIALGIGIRKLVLETSGLTEEVNGLNEASKKMRDISKENLEIAKELEKARKGESDSIKTQTQLNVAAGNANQINLDTLNKLDKKIKDSTTNTFALANARRAYVTGLQAQAALNEDLKEQVQTELELAGIVGKSGRLISNRAENMAKLREIFEKIVKPQIDLSIAQRDFSNSMKEAEKPMADFRNSLRAKTPYDEANAAIKSVGDSLVELAGLAGADDAAGIENRLKSIAEGATAGLSDVFSQQMQEKLKKVRDAGPDGALEGTTDEQRKFLGLLSQEILERQELTAEAQKQAIVAKTNVASFNRQATVLQKIQFSEAAAVKLTEVKNAGIDAGIKKLQADLNLHNDINVTEENRLSHQTKRLDLETQIKVLQDQRLTNEDTSLQIAQNQLSVLKQRQIGAQALLDIQSGLNAAAAAALALDSQRLEQQAKMSSQAAGRGFAVTAEQELEIAGKLFEQRKTAIEAEKKVRDEGIRLQFALMEAQMQVQLKEIEVINAKHRQAVEEFRMKNAPGAMGLPIADLIDTGPLTEAMARVGDARTAAFAKSAAEETQALEALQNDLIEKGFAARKAAATREQKEALDRLQTEQSGQKALNDIVQKTINSEKSLLDEKRESLEATARAQSLANPAIREEVITAAQRADIEKQLQDDRIAIVVKERDLKIAMINMEHDLLKARLAVGKAEAEFRLRELNFSDAEIAKITGHFDTAMATVADSRSAAIGAVGLESSNQIAGIVTDVAKAAQDKINEAAGITTGTEGNITSPNAAADLAIQNAVGVMKDEEATLTEKTGAMANAALELQNTLNSFGLENPAMTAALQGAVDISAAWTGAFKTIKDENASATDKIQAGLGAVGATIGSMASMYKASSDQRIKGIDSEIEAEKKRDGKSQESLAKIAGLEKKKQNEKRKAFEMQKKMQAAQTLISTIQAAMSVYSSLAPIPFVGPALGAAAAAGVIAMGMKHVQMIRSQSMDGGGSAGAGQPTGVSLGSRGSSVDTAKSQSMRGELAYFRGERGTGSAENFKPAFAGARYRAAGGETAGYMVGEQGPELFVPETPGRIVPNDDMPVGAPINATFNINTIDASGVEDILVAQRGNIIGMIREGANSYGQTFLEDIDTSVYTPSAGGASKY